MSSEQAFAGSDLRSAAQDYKRDAEHKAKWAMGVTITPGRGEANPRPRKRSETYVYWYQQDGNNKLTSVS